MLPKFLTTNYRTEKHLFLIPKLALSLIGFYPESKSTPWLQLWAFFNFAILTYGCYAELYFGIYHLTIDVVKALDALCPVASSLMGLLKIFFIWQYRADFKRMIERVRVLTEAQNTPIKIQIKQKYFTLSTRLSALVLFLGIATATSYSLRTILLNVVRYWYGEEIVYETPFKMMFPDVLLKMPLYPITFLFVHWHGYITASSFAAADGLFLCFCAYFTTLLMSLQEDVKLVLAETKNDTIYSTEMENIVCKKLRDIIDRHNEIADLIDELKSIIVEITLGHFISSSLIIGTSVIDMLLFSGYGIAVYVIYTSCVFTELFLYCLGGTMLIESSKELANVAYCSHWYSHSVKVHKMVLLLMVRAQRNMSVKVPFFSPSLESLTSILRFTGSLVALVKTIL